MQYYLRKYHFTLLLVLALLQGCGSDEQVDTSEKELLENTLTLERVNPISLDVGGTYQNIVSALGSGNIVYSSTNEDVATVDENGVITAHKFGNADIVITQEADEEYSQATETFSVKVGFTVSAWISEEATTLNIPSGAEGTQLFRTKNFECDYLNNLNCNSGVLDFLSEGILIDENTGLNSPSSYHFTNEDKTNGFNIHFPVKHLTGRSNASILSFKDKVWTIGGVGGSTIDSRYGNDDVWSTEDGINWKQELADAPFGKLSGAQSIVFKNKIWIYGGYVGFDRWTREKSLKTWSSSDGKNWELKESNFPYEEGVNYLFEFEQKVWVVSTDYQAKTISLRSSENGTDWVLHEHNISYGEFSSKIIQWKEGLIALGQEGTVWVSEDGLNWSSKEIETTQIDTELTISRYPRGIIQKINSKLFALSSHTDDSVWISEDGLKWKEFKAINPDHPSNIVTDGLKIVHKDQLWSINSKYSNSYIEVTTSSNGINWSEISYINEVRSSYDIVSFKDKFLLLGGYNHPDRAKRIYSSLDGIDWKLETENAAFGPRNSFATFEHLDKLWLAGGKDDTGDNNDLWYSDDGITWTKSEYTMPVDATVDYSNINFISFNEKIWLFPSYDSSEDRIIHVWSTTNLVDWKKEAEIPNLDGYSDRVDVSVINDQIWLQQGTISNSDSGYEINNLWHSSDGKNWSEVNPLLPSILSFPGDLIFITFNSQFYLIGADGPLDESFILTSNNGYDWDLIDSSPNTKLFDRFDGVIYVIEDDKIWMFGELLAIMGSTSGYSTRLHPKASVWRSNNLSEWEKGTKVRIAPFERR